jgi:hypothetical protein
MNRTKEISHSILETLESRAKNAIKFCNIRIEKALENKDLFQYENESNKRFQYEHLLIDIIELELKEMI